MNRIVFKLVVSLMIIGSVFAVSIDCASADTESDYKFTVNLRGEANITGYNGDGGAIIIPKTLSGYPTKVISSNTFAYCSSITSVIIPNGVTTIGNNVFYYCTNLTTITIPNSVENIGVNAFAYCSSLISINIPNKVKTIKDSSFYSCNNLASITIGENVTDIEYYAFYKCTNLTTLTIPDNVIMIGANAFWGCSSLTSVSIGNNVTTIHEKAFWGCTSLENVTIGKSAKSIGSYVFNQCSNLKSISFVGLTAPISVSSSWITDTPAEIRGHAYKISNFPAPKSDFYGLIMGSELVHENSKLDVEFTWIPVANNVNQTITFDASASNNPDGSLVLYEWDWNNDGEYEETNSIPNATHIWTQKGNYTVNLRVTDNQGLIKTKSQTVMISDAVKESDGETPGFHFIFLLCAIAILILVSKRGKHK